MPATADQNRRAVHVDPSVKLWIKRRAQQKRQTQRVVVDEIVTLGIAALLKREKLGGFKDDQPV